MCYIVGVTYTPQDSAMMMLFVWARSCPYLQCYKCDAHEEALQLGS